MRRIFQLNVEQHLGFRCIAQLLNRDGILSPRGLGWADQYTGTWRPHAVKAILENPHYVGDMVWNRRSEGRFFTINAGNPKPNHGGKRLRVLDNKEADWIRIRDAHPAIVTRRTFELASLLRRNRSRSKPAGSPPQRPISCTIGSRARFILSGLMSCARCGMRYSGLRARPAWVKKGDESYTRGQYLCRGFVIGGMARCHAGRVEQLVLERAVCEALVSYYARYLGRAGERLLAGLVARAVDAGTSALEAERERLVAADRELARGLKNLAKNVTPKNRGFVEARIEELEAEKASGVLRTAEIDLVRKLPVEPRRVLAEARAAIGALPRILEGGARDERALALRRVVESIVYDADSRLAHVRLRQVPSGDLAGLVEEVLVTLPRRKGERRREGERPRVGRVARVG